MASKIAKTAAQTTKKVAIGTKKILEKTARAVKKSGNSIVPNKVEGAVIKPNEPKILSDKNLSADELKFLQREFLIKKRAIERAANRGELAWSPKTTDTRISSLQKSYRDAVTERFVRRYGVEPDLSRLNADHPVDLVIGGSATQRLKLLNESINKSVGSSLLQAGRKAQLNVGDLIKDVQFQKRK